MNTNIFKTKEARIGVIIILSLVVIIIGFNLIKMGADKGKNPYVFNASQNKNKLGIVQKIEHNAKQDNFIITIVFKNTDMVEGKKSKHATEQDTVTITVEKHLLKQVLKNYEIPPQSNISELLQSNKLSSTITTNNKTTKEVRVDLPKKTDHSTTINHDLNTNTKDVNFRIQFFMSETWIEPNAEQFDKIHSVLYYKDNKYFKYTTGRFNSFSEAKRALQNMLAAYPEAFIVAFNGENRIPVLDAKKLLRNK